MKGKYVPTLAVPNVTRQYWQLVMVDLESVPRGLYGMDEHRTKLHKELAAHYELTHEETKRITDNMDKIKYGSQGLHQALQDMWYDKQ